MINFSSKEIFASIIVLFWTTASFGGGIEHTDSKNDFKKTVSFLKANLKDSGFFVVRQIDHERNAKDVGEKVPLSTVVLFNKPLLNSVLISQNSDAALFLPLRIAVVEKDDGKVHLVWEKIESIAEQAGIKLSSHPGANELVEKASLALQESISKTIELPNKKKSK